jgi:hypothetical protein
VSQVLDASAAPSRFEAAVTSGLLAGLRQLYFARGELQTPRQYGEQALAQRLQAPTLLSEVHYTLGAALDNLGELRSAYAHFEQGMTLADVRLNSRIGARCRMLAAPTLWHLGYSDQALQRSHEALTLAQSLDPQSVYHALHVAGVIHWLRREVQAAHATTPASCWRRSTAGSPSGLIPPTCRTPGHCWRI